MCGNTQRGVDQNESFGLTQELIREHGVTSMQKLQEKLKNVPTDASQVCSSTSSLLNKEEIPSAESKVLSCNTPEGNLLQHTGERNLRVSVKMCVSEANDKTFASDFSKNTEKILDTG